MIQLKEITPEEAEKLNSERSTSYWAIPIALTVGLFLFTLIFNWLLSVPWSIFWWTSGGLFALSASVRLINGKPPQLIGGTMKIVRRGKVLELKNKGNSPVPKSLNIGQHIDITLEHVPSPSGYPERDTFTVNQTLGMSYFPQNASLKHRKKYVLGTEIEIEYLAESGTVIAYRELNPASNPPTVNVQFGTIELSGRKPSLPQSRIDFIVLASDNYGNPGIFLRSDSLPDELFVPQFAIKLHRLEEGVFSLNSF